MIFLLTLVAYRLRLRFVVVVSKMCSSSTRMCFDLTVHLPALQNLLLWGEDGPQFIQYEDEGPKTLKNLGIGPATRLSDGVTPAVVLPCRGPTVCDAKSVRHAIETMLSAADKGTREGELLSECNELPMSKKLC